LLSRDFQERVVANWWGHRFSAYIFGRAGRDEDVLRVGDVLEKALGIRELLKPYVEAKSEIGDI